MLNASNKYLMSPLYLFLAQVIFKCKVYEAILGMCEIIILQNKCAANKGKTISLYSKEFHTIGLSKTSLRFLSIFFKDIYLHEG